LLHSPFEDDSEGAFYYSSEDAEGGRASSATFNVGRHPQDHSYCPWHHFQLLNKTVDNVEKMYPYPQDDLVVSHNKPGQNCFTCGSEKHWVHNCKYFRVYSNHLERKMLKKEHWHYKMPDYKVAYSAMVNAMPNF
jgi:hypothetical protein